MLEILQLIAAEPMFRAPSPEILAELKGVSAACNIAVFKKSAAVRTYLCERVTN
jgi:hypothetical protein